MISVLIKPESTTTEDSQRLEIFDLGSRCIFMYYVEKTKVLISGVVAIQLICVFVFRIWKKQIFSCGGSNVHLRKAFK